MVVTYTDTGTSIEVGAAPAIIVVLQVDADPRVFAPLRSPGGPIDEFALRRILLDLPDEWRDLLLECADLDPGSQPT